MQGTKKKVYSYNGVLLLMCIQGKTNFTVKMLWFHDFIFWVSTPESPKGRKPFGLSQYLARLSNPNALLQYLMKPLQVQMYSTYIHVHTCTSEITVTLYVYRDSVMNIFIWSIFFYLVSCMLENSISCG